LIVAENASHKKVTTVDGRQDCSATAAQHPLPVPTIRVEMSSSSEQYDMPSYEPEKLHRVDDPPLRTPRVAVNNMLLVQPDNTITFGSPKVASRQHGVVGRTLSADSYCLSSKHLTCDGHSPARSSRSSRTSSTGKRSRASSVSERSHFANCDYVDDFDESSDVDEGYVSYYV